MKFHIVANRAPAKPDISIKEFEAGTEGKLRCVLGLDPKSFSAAGMKGQSVVGSNPKHRIVPPLHRLCIELAGVPEEPRHGFLKRVFGRKK